jgi:methylmalonyl-CoA/ethylmalonyl-CoA epimerase
MKATLDHVGIAVGDVSASLRFFRDALGLEVDPPEDVPSQQVRVTFLPAGESSVELLEPTSAESAVSRYLAKRGAGMHHVAFRVDDIREAIAELKARGVRLIDEVPRPGAHGSLVAFIHPSATDGVLVELKQAHAAR